MKPAVKTFSAAVENHMRLVQSAIFIFCHFKSSLRLMYKSDIIINLKHGT